MTDARPTGRITVVHYAEELPGCDHCGEPVVAVRFEGDWAWRHAFGSYRCRLNAVLYATVEGFSLVSYRSLLTTDN